ncbi:hypothetical protein AG1IA_05952 [Rhizoctonia solani AG-1 IA]|uniref:Uncharacterized protein n=2 Tax=Rhizoctonia solani TaxID=456999 RepID=L8WTD4_THACA|nr:hypothetical protein AG1IA_05952 [Rhizoctonia solani AG-1 IA]
MISHMNHPDVVPILPSGMAYQTRGPTSGLAHFRPHIIPGNDTTTPFFCIVTLGPGPMLGYKILGHTPCVQVGGMNRSQYTLAIEMRKDAKTKKRRHASRPRLLGRTGRKDIGGSMRLILLRGQYKECIMLAFILGGGSGSSSDPINIGMLIPSPIFTSRQAQERCTHVCRKPCSTLPLSLSRAYSTPTLIIRQYRIMLFSRLFSIIAVASVIAPVISIPLPRPISDFEIEAEVVGLEIEVEKKHGEVEIEIEKEGSGSHPLSELEVEIKVKEPGVRSD